MMRQRQQELKVSVNSRLRQYTYTAILTPTGKLQRITAGCREWETFEAATAHYQGTGPDANKWGDRFIYERRADFWQAARMVAHRLDARNCLYLLATQVQALQESIARRKRRASIKKRLARESERRKLPKLRSARKAANKR